ncbi:MAG: NAD(+) synthase [Bacteroidales bacterium]|nr:NAD(+) synthase [Bacteroidales bacterium]
MKYGFVKVAAAVPSLRVADAAYNAGQIISLMNQADKQQVEIVCFPELSVTGYTCGDLFFQQALLQAAEEALSKILYASEDLALTAIVGMPLCWGGRLYNVAVALHKGIILSVVPKSYLPGNHEFYEPRWFSSGLDLETTRISLCGQDCPLGTRLLTDTGNACFAIEICEDLWSVVPPSSHHALAGADVVFNLSASNELTGKHDYLLQLIAQQSGRCLCGYVYASAGYGESSTDLVFGGNGIIAESGTLLAQSERFSFEQQLIVSEIDIERLRHDRLHSASFKQDERPAGYQTVAIPEANQENESLTREIRALPFVPQPDEMDTRCREIFAIQVGGLVKRMEHTGAKTAVVGISGGLDSTLALLVCVKAFDQMGRGRHDIVGITMPGFGTSDRTHTNAVNLMKYLHVTNKEIDIKAACRQHFSDIGHDESRHDVVYENSQARERTQILMDYANAVGGLVIGTGDLSELALGWATFNGDHMANYGVNGGVPKTLIRYLVRWVADNEMDEASRTTLLDVLDTPVSPELLPTDKLGRIAQKTEDLVGPYELHDFFLYYMLRYGFGPEKVLFLARHAFQGQYDEAVIRHWLQTFVGRFFAQQFKRSCLPDGPKVGSIGLSPRGDWRMPSDAVAKAWLAQMEK